MAKNDPNNFSVGTPSRRRKFCYSCVKRLRMVTVECAVTQEDQDNADEEKLRESMHTLIQTWQDSLQLISVIVNNFLNCPKLYKLISNYLHSSDNILCRD
jgi:hypothetical protein